MCIERSGVHCNHFWISTRSIGRDTGFKQSSYIRPPLSHYFFSLSFSPTCVYTCVSSDFTERRSIRIAPKVSKFLLISLWRMKFNEKNIKTIIRGSLNASSSLCNSRRKIVPITRTIFTLLLLTRSSSRKRVTKYASAFFTRPAKMNKKFLFARNLGRGTLFRSFCIECKTKVIKVVHVESNISDSWTMIANRRSESITVTSRRSRSNVINLSLYLINNERRIEWLVKKKREK